MDLLKNGLFVRLYEPQVQQGFHIVLCRQSPRKAKVPHMPCALT